MAKINFHTILSIFEEKNNFFSANKSISSDSIQQFCSPSPKNSPLIFKKSIRKESDQSNSNFSKLKNSDNISIENSLVLKSLKSLCDYKTDSIDEICISKNSFSSNEFDIFSNKSENLIDYNCSCGQYFLIFFISFSSSSYSQALEKYVILYRWSEAHKMLYQP